GAQWLPEAAGLGWALGAIGRARWLLSRLRVDGLMAMFGYPCLLASSFLTFHQAWEIESPDRPFRLNYTTDDEFDWSVFIGEYMDKVVHDRQAEDTQLIEKSISN
ncbi:MAG: hypothetical protein LBP22_06135, partial [Deltaproteobacteria bacterium]|nr:hypothetical protein [Deltaproteobacteria bacterium]